MYRQDGKEIYFKWGALKYATAARRRSYALMVGRQMRPRLPMIATAINDASRSSEKRYTGRFHLVYLIRRRINDYNE